MQLRLAIERYIDKSQLLEQACLPACLLQADVQHQQAGFIRPFALGVQIHSGPPAQIQFLQIAQQAFLNRIVKGTAANLRAWIAGGQNCRTTAVFLFQ